MFRTALPLLTILAIAVPLSAGDAPQASPGEIGELIDRLGQPAFEVREQAARQLVEFGSAALPALKDASESDDLEIRYRARRVLLAVEEREHELRLQAFLDEKGEQPDDVLPGWGRFRRDVGSDPKSREFFVKMQRAERRLFTALERQEPNLAETFAKRCIEIQYRYSYSGTRRIDAERTAALLFLSGDTSLELDASTQMRMYSFCNYNDFSGLVRSGDRQKMAKNIVGCWIARDDEADGNVLYQRTRLAMQFNIKQGLLAAKKSLEGGVTNDYRAQYALLALGKFGGAEELPMVESLFSRKTVLQRSTVKNKPAYTCELRDVALAVALHLTGQETKPYGFAKLQKQSMYLYLLNSAGFNTPKAREDAFARYAAWKKGELDEKPEADTDAAKSSETEQKPEAGEAQAVPRP